MLHKIIREKKNIQKVFFSFAVGIAGNDDLLLHARPQDPQILYHMIFFWGYITNFFMNHHCWKHSKDLKNR